MPVTRNIYMTDKAEARLLTLSKKWSLSYSATVAKALEQASQC